MDFFVNAAKLLVLNAETLWYVGAIMVSIVITIIGVLKKFVFNHIANKGVRKTVLASSNIFLSFLTTAGYFWVDSRDWHWYWVGGAVTAITCILVYFIYENFHIRDVFHKIGSFAITKFSYLANVVWDKLFHKTDKNIKAEWKGVQKELQNFAKNEIKVATKKFAKADKELENL